MDQMNKMFELLLCASGFLTFLLLRRVQFDQCAEGGVIFAPVADLLITCQQITFVRRSL